ncbi:MAG: polysulfide reductase NrfD [Flavobacteriales bacterium]|nr:polysulfide reductase NrfD [Flavobacteriales bacterium]
MNINRTLPELTQDLQPRTFGLKGTIWTIGLCVVFLAGLVNYFFQLRDGLEITAMTDYVSWGIYISNFVFFVAVSLVGSLISAILKLSNAKWSIPLTRIAEIIAVACIMFAGLIIIVDMGRPDRIYYLFVHGRLQSPIVWDVIVVTTYLAISTLLLYIPLLPDFAILRDKMTGIPKWQHKLYSMLSLGWVGNAKQMRIMHKSIMGLSVIIIPIAFGIHTVTSWLFSTTLRGGWNSTNIGPYFIAGAFMVGAAAVIAVMYVVRRSYKLENYFTDDLFDKMAKLLVLLSLVYFYFNINEYLTPAFKMMEGERDLLESLFMGEFAPMFWTTQIVGMIIPIIVLLFKKGRKPLPLFIISLIVIVGAWFKRYLIVIPTLFYPYLPAIEQDGVPRTIEYAPTFAEWSITFGSLAGALLVITILLRYLPVVGIWEMAEYQGIVKEEE